MSDKNKDLILRWFDEVWNNGNENTIDELFHPEVQAHGLGPDPIGIEGFKSFYRTFRKHFKNIEVTVEKTLLDRDYVVALCKVATMHIETGKPVNISGTSIAEIRDGKIVNGWNYFDFLSLNVQIGKISPEQIALN